RRPVTCHRRRDRAGQVAGQVAQVRAGLRGVGRGESLVEFGAAQSAVGVSRAEDLGGLVSFGVRCPDRRCAWGGRVWAHVPVLFASEVPPSARGPAVPVPASAAIAVSRENEPGAVCHWAISPYRPAENRRACNAGSVPGGHCPAATPAWYRPVS